MAELLCFLLGGVAGTWVGAASAFSLRHSRRLADLVLAPWRRKRQVVADIRRRGW